MLILAVLLVVFLAWLLAIRPHTGNRELPYLQSFRYAHRGWHDKPQIPENSMPAFRRAVQNGFAAELDIHLTTDGKLAVIHDSDLTRVTGEAGIVEELSFQELERYRLEGTNETIPCLEQVLEVFEGRAPLLIELKVWKGNEAALCQAAAALLDGYDGRFCLESFQPQAVLWLKKHRPHWVRGQLVCDLRKAGESHGALADFAFSNLLTNIVTKPDFIAYQFQDRQNLSNRLCRWLYQPGEFNWTIRTPQDQKQAEADGRVIIFESFDPRQTDV